MKESYSKTIALSAISAALAVIFLLLGAFVEILDISCIMIAGIAIMLPLSKKYYLGAFLAFVASALIGIFVTGARFTVIVPYAMFFGLHPIVNSLQRKFRINKFLALAVKDVWFLATMFVYYLLLKNLTGYDLFADFSFIPENLQRFLIPALFISGAVFFVLYDSVMLRLQYAVDALIKRLKL